MKKILLSLGTLVVVGAVVAGATIAFYNDTETSTGNIFVAGSIDLKVDHTYASYNGVECVGDCTPTGNELIVNGGFETPNLSSGQWQVYPAPGILGWAVDYGAGIEIQDHAAGNPHSGSQLVELDSNGPGSQTAMSQVVSTTPGQKYRLSFWHSSRPGNNQGDNATSFTVKVTSTSGVIVNNTVEEPAITGSSTVWNNYTYNFIALDTQTTIQFADAGSQQDTYGGYLDDVSLFALNCPSNPSYPNGGVCSVWGERDLGLNDKFWSFPDIKPGDYGTDVISLHVYDNDAFACLLPSNIADDENIIVDPEVAASDGPLVGNPPGYGELSNEIEVFLWNDKNNNGVFDPTEQIYVNAGTPFNQIQSTMIAMSLVGNAPIDFVGMSWCAGDQTGPTVSNPSTALSCDGNGMGNIAQTDKVIADFVAYAVQQRNNSSFSCASVVLP